MKLKNYTDIIIIVLGILSYIYLFFKLIFKFDYTLIAFYFITLLVGYFVIGKYIFILNFCFILIDGINGINGNLERFYGMNDGIVEHSSRSRNSNIFTDSIKPPLHISQMMAKKDAVTGFQFTNDVVADYSDNYNADINKDRQALSNAIGPPPEKTKTALDKFKQQDKDKLLRNSDRIINKNSDKKAMVNSMPSLE